MIEETDEEKFNELLEAFSKLTFKERKNPTFLEIMKQSDRETVWSNILVFYFDTNKEHNLKDLMLKSFFEALGENIEITNLNTIKVWPEFSTENHKRIDLLIKADNFVLGIENKVNHLCNNPFEDYAKKIDDIANGRKKFKVVLSKNHYHEVNGFVNLTYDRFIKSIKKNLPDYKASANSKYLRFLKDFLKNIENTIKCKDMIDNEKSLEYFQKNYDTLEILAAKFLKFKEQVRQTFTDIHTAIDLSKLDLDFKKKYGDEAIICKESIFDQDENGFPEFRIFINNGKTINYWIYLDSGMSQIYCYAEPQYESAKGIFLETENFGEKIKISEETKVAARKIINQIEKIIDNIFVD